MALRRFLLDANAAADVVYHRRGVDRRFRETRSAGNPVGVAIPILGELFAGVEFSSTRDFNMPILIKGIRLFRQWPFDVKAAQEY